MGRSLPALSGQSSTLENNLRALGRVYDWAESVGGFDLDDYLPSGKSLTARLRERACSACSVAYKTET